MASLISMGCVHTGADQGMACVCAAAERCLHVRSVVRVNIRRIVDSVCFCCRNQLTGIIVAVSAAAVFDTDGYLVFLTLQSIADTSHINGKDICYTLRNGSRSAVADLLIYSDMLINRAGQCYVFFF